MTQFLAVPVGVEFDTFGFVPTELKSSKAVEIAEVYFFEDATAICLLRDGAHEIDRAFEDYCRERHDGHVVEGDSGRRLESLISELFAKHIPFVCWYADDWRELPEVSTQADLKNLMKDACSHQPREFYFAVYPR